MNTKNIFRMLLVAAALLLGANNVKAQDETQIWPESGTESIWLGNWGNANGSKPSFSADIFSNFDDGDILRVYVTQGDLNEDYYQFQLCDANWTQLYYKEGNKISGYIDINVDQTMIDKLSGGAIIQGYNLYINKLARIPSQPLQQGENIVWEGSNWFNNWQNALYLSTSMFKKASAGNTVRIYGTFNNGWAVEFLYITNSWQKFSIPEWGDKSQANDQTVTTPGNGGYIEFALTETNLELITGNSQCIVQGTNFEVKKVAIYVGQSDDRTQPTISFGETTAFYQTYGDTFTAPTATCSVNSLTITYTSSNSNVAEVNSSTGSVSIKGAGQATITASTEATTEYKAASASYTIYVGKANVSLYYSSSSATATIGEEWTAPTLSNPQNVSVTYSSSDTDIATIASDGAVTLVAAGTTTIKATYAGDNNHNAAETSYTLTVNSPENNKADVTLSFSSSTSLVRSRPPLSPASCLMPAPRRTRRWVSSIGSAHGADCWPMSCAAPSRSLCPLFCVCLQGCLQ